jgi:hypothetical protein
MLRVVFVTNKDFGLNISEWEREEGVLLKLQERAGAIHDLEAQVVFPILVCGKKITSFKIDYRYKVVEVQFYKEVKGHFRTQDRIRFKGFLAQLKENEICLLQWQRDRQFYRVRLSKTGRIEKFIKVNSRGREIWKAWKYK